MRPGSVCQCRSVRRGVELTSQGAGSLLVPACAVWILAEDLVDRCQTCAFAASAFVMHKGGPIERPVLAKVGLACVYGKRQKTVRYKIGSIRCIYLPYLRYGAT